MVEEHVAIPEIQDYTDAEEALEAAREDAVHTSLDEEIDVTAELEMGLAMAFLAIDQLAERLDEIDARITAFNERASHKI